MGKLGKNIGTFCPSACQHLTCLCLTIAVPCSEKASWSFPLKPQLRIALWGHLNLWSLCFCMWSSRRISGVKSNTDVLLLQELRIHLLWLQCDTRPSLWLRSENISKKYARTERWVCSAYNRVGMKSWINVKMFAVYEMITLQLKQNLVLCPAWNKSGDWKLFKTPTVLNKGDASVRDLEKNATLMSAPGSSKWHGKLPRLPWLWEGSRAH